MADEVKEEDKTPVKILFLYRHDHQYIYADVTDLDNDGTPLPDIYKEGKERVKSYTGGLYKDAKPGQVFACTRHGNTVFYSKRGFKDYVGMWENAEDVVRWRSRHEAYEAVRQAEAAYKKDGAKKHHLEVLDPLRTTYRRLPAPARAQLLALVVRYLTS